MIGRILRGLGSLAALLLLLAGLPAALIVAVGNPWPSSWTGQQWQQWAEDPITIPFLFGSPRRLRLAAVAYPRCRRHPRHLRPCRPRPSTTATVRLTPAARRRHPDQRGNPHPDRRRRPRIRSPATDHSHPARPAHRRPADEHTHDRAGTARYRHRACRRCRLQLHRPTARHPLEDRTRMARRRQPLARDLRRELSPPLPDRRRNDDRLRPDLSRLGSAAAHRRPTARWSRTGQPTDPTCHQAATPPTASPSTAPSTPPVTPSPTVTSSTGVDTPIGVPSTVASTAPVPPSPVAASPPARWRRRGHRPPTSDSAKPRRDRR